MALDDKTLKKMSQAQLDTLDKIINEAMRQGVNPDLAVALAEAETGGAFSHMRGDKVLMSPAGAVGLMQIMPDTAKLFSKKFGFEINPEDESSNIKGGVAILKDLLDQTKKPRNAVALYNASPRAVANFIKTYETDPDAALSSLPKETFNYLDRVAGNFNLDDEKETGLIAPQESVAAPAAPVDPFAGITSEAAKMKREEDERKKKEPAAAPVVDQAAKDAEQQVMGAVAGAAANAALPALTSPEMPEKVDISRVQERANERADALELARRNFREQAGEFTSFEEIQNRNLANQQELERIKNEQRLAQERLRGLPRATPVLEVLAPSLQLPQAVREGRASGPKVEGDSGTRNWMIQEAGQKHQLPEAILDLATGKTKDSPTGGKALIDQDLANLEKLKQLGMGDSRLVTMPSGAQLQLPENFASEIQTEAERQSQANQAEVEQRAEQARLQQDAQAQQLEQQRLAYEADLERLRQERAEAGRRLNETSGQIKTVTPLRKAVTKAETDAELARRRLSRAPEPTTTTGRAALNAGKTTGRAIVGGLAGVGGVMSLQEALERFKAGDTSEGVLKTIQASSAAAMLTPPINKSLSGVRKLGALGAIGSYGYDFGRELFRKNPQEAK